MAEEPSWHGDALFLRRVLLAILLLGLALLLWQLRFILVLAFGATLLAVIFRSAVRPLHRKLRIPEGAALALTVLVVFGCLVGLLALFGAEVSRQMDAIAVALPAALEEVRELAERARLGGWLDERIDDLSGGMGGGLGGILMTVGDGLTQLVILLFGAVFLAARPRLYRTGVVKLMPPSVRSEAGGALDDCENALRLWFKGRLMAMVLVGTLTGLGLWLIGVPSFLALGLLAGVLEFIPFFGPLLAAVPGVLLALLVSPTHALFAALLYLAIQQAEGNLITPVIQHHAVELPPALLLFSLLAFGLLFGLLGVVLAEPLTVACFVLVKKLYVRGVLRTETPLPGEDDH